MVCIRIIIGLVRFATEKYKRGLNSLGKKFAHLTNYSVNKHSGSYMENNHDSITIDQLKPSNISKWDFPMLKMKYEELNVHFDKIWDGIKDIII